MRVAVEHATKADDDRTERAVEITMRHCSVCATFVRRESRQRSIECPESV
jgi:hypothetical protein